MNVDPQKLSKSKWRSNLISPKLLSVLVGIFAFYSINRWLLPDYFVHACIVDTSYVPQINVFLILFFETMLLVFFLRFIAIFTQRNHNAHDLRWYQFSLRSLLIFTFFVGLGSSYLKYWLDTRSQVKMAEAAKSVNAELSGGRLTVHELNSYKLKYIGEVINLNIKSLTLEGPSVNDETIQCCRTLTNLEELILYDTQVSDDGLECLANLTNLRHLHLGSQKVTDAGLIHLKNLSNLKWLGISFPIITENGLARLQQLKNIEALSLSGMTDASVKQVIKMNNLQILLLEGFQITDTSLKYISEMQQLRGLHLFDTRISDAGLEHLKEMNTLERLKITGSAINGSGLKYLINLHQLEDISLDRTQVSDAGLVHLQGMPKLLRLDLFNTKVSDDGVDKLKKTLPNVNIVR